MKTLLFFMLFLGSGIVLFAGPAREREKRITLELAGNPTTGYSWTYTMDREGIVREVSTEYRGASGSGNPNTPGRAGQGGVFVFVFEGLKPGTVELRFNYARPWESGVEPAETRTYVLTVTGTGKITRRPAFSPES
jgi:inhibitor of cysteine peptidase